jgi:hypothetical protein
MKLVGPADLTAQRYPRHDHRGPGFTPHFYAEGDEAAEYLSFMEDRGEAAVIDLIVDDKLVDFDQENTPEPADEDDEVFESILLI